MRQTRTLLDRIATLAALRLLAWIGKRVDPDQQLWLEALRWASDLLPDVLSGYLVVPKPFSRLFLPDL